MYGGLAALCRPRTLAVATAIAIPAWGCECVGFALIVNAFPGAHVDARPRDGDLRRDDDRRRAVVPARRARCHRGRDDDVAGDAARRSSIAATALDATLLTRLATLWFAVVLGLVFLAVARRRIAGAPPRMTSGMSRYTASCR